MEQFKNLDDLYRQLPLQVADDLKAVVKRRVEIEVSPGELGEGQWAVRLLTRSIEFAEFGAMRWAECLDFCDAIAAVVPNAKSYIR